MTSALAEANGEPPGGRDTRPLFVSLFSPRPAGQQVAPVVNALWGPQARADAASPAGSGNDPVRLLELFQDSRPTVRKLFDGSA